MDIRFSLVEMPLAVSVMERQIEGWRENAEEPLPRWPDFDRAASIMQEERTSRRPSLLGTSELVAMLSRLLPIPRRA